MESKFEQKNNTGITFKNHKKEIPTHADQNGTITVDGKVYWLNRWDKKDKNGNDMSSYSVKLKQ